MSITRRHGRTRAGGGWLVAAMLLGGGGPAVAAEQAPARTPAASGSAAADPAGLDPMATATRGMTGTITITDDGPGLAPRADLSLEAPLVARIAARRDVAGSDTKTTYEIQFIGTVEGMFDVRTALQRPDGSFPADLDPLPVMIERNLDASAGTDVFVDAEPPAPISGRYRTTLIVLFAAWALVPVVVVGTRLVRRLQVSEPDPPPPPPSLAERLEPLVIAAAERSMTVEERGRLELLLIAHLGERRDDVDADTRAELIAGLRRDPDAGPLLRAVESWLHRPGPVEPRRQAVAGLLAPFRRGASVASPPTSDADRDPDPHPHPEVASS